MSIQMPIKLAICLIHLKSASIVIESMKTLAIDEHYWLRFHVWIVLCHNVSQLDNKSYMRIYLLSSWCHINLRTIPDVNIWPTQPDPLLNTMFQLSVKSTFFFLSNRFRNISIYFQVKSSVFKLFQLQLHSVIIVWDYRNCLDATLA